MANKATRYERIIFYPGGVKVVNIGKTGRQSCTTLPESLQECRDLIKAGPNSSGDTFNRGPGDVFILNNRCELKYYLDNRLVAHLK